MNQQLKTLHQALPRKTREADTLQNELRLLEAQRAAAARKAHEAKRRKEGGAGSDNLELKGRWYRGVEIALSEMLGVRS